MNIYKSSDDIWFLLVVSPDKIPAVAEGIGRTDLLRDPRFADPAKLAVEYGPADGDSGRDLQRAAYGALARSLRQSPYNLRFGAGSERRYQGSAVERERHCRSARGRWREPKNHDQQSYSSARRH